MFTVGEFIRNRRLELGLSKSELTRRTENKNVPAPIKHRIYVSRVEAGDDPNMPSSSISIDKCWAFAVVLKVDPTMLFLLSRDLHHLIDPAPAFATCDNVTTSLPLYLKSLRHAAGLTLGDVMRRSESEAWSISDGYLCQLEADVRGVSERISGEKLWTLGRVFDVDPLLLYAMSRNMDSRFLLKSERDSLFT